MAFAVANGVIHATRETINEITGALFRRVDGPSPRWEIAQEWTYPAPQATAEIRGLTTIVDPVSGDHEVMLLGRGPAGTIERVDPLAGYESTVELDIRQHFREAWGYYAPGGASLPAYNRMTPTVDPNTGERVHLLSLWVTNPDTAADAARPLSGFILVRHADRSYSHARIHDLSLVPHPELRGVRDIEPSPWGEDGGRVYYLGGYDCSGYDSHETAWIARLVVPEDTTPPERVTAALARALPGRVRLTWDAPPGAAGVRVQRSAIEAPDALGDGTVVCEDPHGWCVDDAVEDGTLYTYALFARDAAGNHAAPVLAGAVPASTPDPVTLRFPPVQDVRVAEEFPTTNFADKTTLFVRGASNADHRSYLLFRPLGLDGTVTSAALRLYNVTVTGDTTVHSVADTTWDVARVTWDTAPPLGAPLATRSAIPLEQFASFDLPAAAVGDGPVSFGLSSSSYSGGGYFYSKEADVAVAPELGIGLVPVIHHPGEVGGLRVERSGAATLVLSWGPDCGSGTLHGIYRGDLRVGYASLAPEPGFCAVEARNATVPAGPGTADFFLVVAGDGVSEGSYGTDGQGGRRPAATGACAPQGAIDTCAP
jgi:hypothetical protein